MWEWWCVVLIWESLRPVWPPMMLRSTSAALFVLICLSVCLLFIRGPIPNTFNVGTVLKLLNGDCANGGAAGTPTWTGAGTGTDIGIGRGKILIITSCSSSAEINGNK